MILYLRVLPGFELAVEERQRPEIRGYPAVIAGSSTGRGTLREVNATAQACGIHPGMSPAQARQVCPECLVLAPDHATCERVWEEICAILRAYTPLVEPVCPGEAVCDLSGCERLWGDHWRAACAIGRQIREETGITPALGLAVNRLVAELASMSASSDGIVLVERGQERRFLEGLPLTALPDLDPRLALTFQVLGLRTLGQFAALPATAVRLRFGTAGELLHRYAQGIDPRPVLPPPPRPAVLARGECEEGTVEEAAQILQHLAEECARALQETRQAGKMISLRLIWEGEDASHPPLLSRQAEPALPPPPPTASPQRGEHETWEDALPIPYRIHSMLPQPGNPKAPPAAVQQSEPAHQMPVERKMLPSRKVSALVRTAVDSAPSILERAHRLLLESWPRDRAGTPVTRRLQALELEVSEFERPIQLSFAELNRIDGTGGLEGMSPNRLQALIQGEEMLASRYGDAAFRHLAHIDPGSVLTERRFRWGDGLPPRKRARPSGRRKR